MLVPEVRTRSMLARRAGCWLPAAQRMPEAAPACSGHGPLRSARPQSLYHHPAPERSWLQLAKVRAPSTQGEQRSWSRSSVLKPQPSWLSVWPKPLNASPVGVAAWAVGQLPLSSAPIWDPRAGAWGVAVFPRAQRLADVGGRVGGSRDPTFPTHPGLLQASPSPSPESSGGKAGHWGAGTRLPYLPSTHLHSPSTGQGSAGKTGPPCPRGSYHSGPRVCGCPCPGDPPAAPRAGPAGRSGRRCAPGPASGHLQE